jgi:ATP-binding cassette subfamily C protein CydC
MRALWQVFALIWRDQRSALLRGATLSVVVLAMGAALLGLSGWFITAAAMAGLAGMGATFDVFRPSAMVRFLALGRAAARYGERLLTHDATLRALESLRLRVLRAHLAAPYDRMIRLRGAQALNRLTADIDALDGVPLRLVLPVLAGVLVLAGAAVVLWALVGPVVALWVTGGYALGSGVVFAVLGARAVPLSRRAEAATQTFRARLIDMIRARDDLVVYGYLSTQTDAVLRAEARRLTLQRQLDRAERLAGLALATLGALVSAGALGLGLWAVQTDTLTPAFAALGFFAALALGETVFPLRRAIADLGRMADAARRVVQIDTGQRQSKNDTTPQAGALVLDRVSLTRAGSAAFVLRDLAFRLDPGQVVAVTGPSGTGKSTLLLAIAGLHPLASGQIRLGGVDLSDCTEATRRAAVTLLPQRSALMAGSMADALRLGTDADDATLWTVLDAVHLADMTRAKGGLGAQIGPRGAGLSGGEARRLTLARALLRRPHLLLLDEPTEGLDEATARRVLRGIRSFLPEAAILIAAHRRAEIDFADCVLDLTEVVNVAPVIDLDQRDSPTAPHNT